MAAREERCETCRFWEERLNAEVRALPEFEDDSERDSFCHRFPPKMRIDLACNDYRNGLFQGWAESAHVHFGTDYDDNLDIEGPRVKVREIDRAFIKIGRVRCFMSSSTEWYGNWCWNSYDIDIFDMRAVVNYLRLRGWKATCGPTELYDAFNATGEITPEKWQELLSLAAAFPSARE